MSLSVEAPTRTVETRFLRSQTWPRRKLAEDALVEHWTSLDPPSRCGVPIVL